MTRRTVAMLLAATTIASNAPAFAGQLADRPTVAIARLDVAQAGWTLPPPELGAAVVDMLMNDLVGSERFHVYDGQWLVPAMSGRGAPSLSELRAAAAERHVDYLVVGTLTQFSTEQKKRRFGGVLPRPIFLGGIARQQTVLHVSLAFRVVDVGTGEVVASVMGDGIGQRHSTGLAGLGVVHGLPIGALASAATASIARDAMLNEALRQAVRTAAISLTNTAPRLTHSAQ